MKKSLVTLIVTIITVLAMAISVSADVVNARFIENENDTGYWYTLDGKKIIGLYETEFDNGIKKMYKYDENGTIAAYNGWAKTSSKRFYYNNGYKISGWRKLSGSWYHFDKKGAMQTGRVKIANGYYTFGTDGKWTGKYSAKAKRPDNFSFYYKGNVEIDTKENYINKPYVSENGKIKYSTSKLDLQVIYCALQEYDVNSLCALDYDIHPEYLTYTNCPDDYEVFSYDPDPYYVTKYVSGNKRYSVRGYSSACELYCRKYNEYAQNYYEFTEFITHYVMQTKEYKSLPENDICLE